MIIMILGRSEVHTKFGPDLFSRFDVYWIQTDRQTDKQSIYLDNTRWKKNLKKKILKKNLEFFLF